ncbi:hypothetical protein MASR2M69_24560 [Bacteroidota bacterium]
MKTIPFFPVFGFLGSGKTTFLKIILDRLGHDFRIGIIQNEFSLSKIESEFQNQSHPGFSLMEVNRSKAICISQTDNFIPDLKSFIDKEKPDAIFLEACGLSDILKVLNIVESPELNGIVYIPKTYMIVDASRYYHEVTFLKTIRNQIRFADTIIVNKYDKLNRLESPEKIVESNNYKKIIEGICDLNPFSKIVSTIYTDIPEEELNFISSEVLLKSQNSLKLHTKVLTSAKRFSDDNIRTLNTHLSECEWAKGYLLSELGDSFAVYSQNGEVNIIPYNQSVEKSELIIKGEDNKLESFFGS